MLLVDARKLKEVLIPSPLKCLKVCKVYQLNYPTKVDNICSVPLEIVIRSILCY